MSTTATPVTAGSAPGGRPRRRPPPDTAFTRWLAASRMKVAELAETLGVTKFCIYNLRSGHHKPSLEVANQIAELSGGAVPASSWGDRKGKSRSKIARAKRHAAKG